MRVLSAGRLAPTRFSVTSLDFHPFSTYFPNYLSDAPGSGLPPSGVGFFFVETTEGAAFSTAAPPSYAPSPSAAENIMLDASPFFYLLDHPPPPLLFYFRLGGRMKRNKPPSFEVLSRPPHPRRPFSLADIPAGFPRIVHLLYLIILFCEISLDSLYSSLVRVRSRLFGIEENVLSILPFLEFLPSPCVFLGGLYG